MTDREFNQVVKERCEKIDSILNRKAKEYARGDRLSNFKRAGGILECSPEFALISFWMKHVTSILDMVDDIEEDKPNAPLSLWEEKIGDAINYLVLLEGLVREKGKETP